MITVFFSLISKHLSPKIILMWILGFRRKTVIKIKFKIKKKQQTKKNLHTIEYYCTKCSTINGNNFYNLVCDNCLNVV